ncbi:MAG: response regulator [Chlorobi bacterium]|nr:response regulator [Chlorobiota bacterium]
MFDKIKAFGSYILIFFVFEIIAIFVFYSIYVRQESSYINAKIKSEEQLFTSVNLHFSELISIETDKLFSDRTLQNKIIEFTNSSKNNSKSIGRSILYDVKKYYSLLQKINAGLLKITLPDGRNVFKIFDEKGKSVVADTNIIKRAYSGYAAEEGFAGYVFVRPIKRNKETIAYLEVGIPFSALQENIELLNSNFVRFVIKDSDLFLRRIYGQYFKSPFKNIIDFVVYRDSYFGLSANKQKAVEGINLSGEDDLRKLLNAKRKSAVAISYNGVNYLISAIPLFEKDNSVWGYALFYDKDSFVSQTRFEFYSYIATTTVVFLIILIFSYTEKIRKIKIEKTNAVLNSILASPENIAILALDRNYKIISFSRSYKVLFNDIEGKIIKEGVNKLDYHKDPLEVKELKKNYDRALRDEQFILIERKDIPKQEPRFFESRYSSIKNEDGKIIGLNVFITDVTEAKTAEQKLHKVNKELEEQIIKKENFEKILRSNNNFLNTVIDTIPSPFYFQNSHGIIQGCNHAFAEEVLGKKKIETIGKTIPELFKGEDISIFLPFIEKDADLLMKGGTEVFEASVKYANGAIRETLFYKATFSDSANKVGGIVNVVLDITDQKRSEAMLISAKQAAEEANKAKSAFLANMSHELRTPLNGILGYTQLLKKDHNLLPEQKNAVDIIHNSGEHLLRLINDILDISKIEAKKIEIVSAAFSLDGLFKNIASIFKDKADKKGIYFLYELKSSLPKTVIGDEVRIRQIFYNLLGNAIKFTSKGGVSFIVRAQESQPKFCKLKVEVIDTGEGIPKDKVQNIFNPFYQIGDERKKMEGTGLGLAITLNLIELMNGKISVRSNEGKGTVFTVELELESASNEKIVETKKDIYVIGYEGLTKKVLIVDDTLENVDLLRHMLRHIGFKTETAENGLDALVKLKSFEPDIILIDLVMPVMNGYEAIKSIRSDDKFRNIPIIALSASIFEDDQIQSLSAGSDAFLPKPIDIDKLLEEMRKLLNVSWKYDRIKHAEEHPLEAALIENEIIPPKREAVPAREILEKIKGFSQMGDITSIKQTLEELEANGDQFSAFVVKINSLAQVYDVDGITNYIIELLQE